MVAHGLVFDALIKAEHIPATLALLAREPRLTVVIDHGAKPDLVTGDLAAWREGSRHSPPIPKPSASSPASSPKPGRTGASPRCSRSSTIC